MKRIVVAEDELIARMDLCETLTDLGYMIVGTASDGFDAVEICRKEHPDVVLMDVKMPLFDGLTAAETILSEELAGCIVLLTAFNDMDIIKRAQDAGVAAYLVKPVNPESLVPTIELAISQSNRLRESQKDLQRAKKKNEDDRKIRKAQMLLARNRNCTEDEAYQWLRKSAMDRRLPLINLVDAILTQYRHDDPIATVKHLLIEKYNYSEEKAYRRIATFAKENHMTTAEGALELKQQLELQDKNARTNL